MQLRDVRGDWLTMNMKVNIMFAKKYDVEKFIGKSWTGLSKISVNAFHVVEEVAICKSFYNYVCVQNCSIQNF